MTNRESGLRIRYVVLDVYVESWASTWARPGRAAPPLPVACMHDRVARWQRRWRCVSLIGMKSPFAPRQRRATSTRHGTHSLDPGQWRR